MTLAGPETDHVVRDFVGEDADFYGTAHDRAQQGEQGMIRSRLRRWSKLDRSGRNGRKDRRRLSTLG